MTESKAVRFGIALPQVFFPGSVDMALVSSFVSRSEALGFGSLWVQERIIGGVDSLEPVNLLSYVAALTTTARLGTSVLIPSTRNPVMLANQDSASFFRAFALAVVADVIGWPITITGTPVTGPVAPVARDKEH